MFVESSLLNKVPGVRHAFFDRQGGVSKGTFASLNTSILVGDDPQHVTQNRARVAAHFEGNSSRLFFAKQVHGNTILEVDAMSDPEEVGRSEADALFCRTPGVLIGVQTADCGTLLLSDTQGKGAMAVHLGWRGVAAGLTQQAVQFYCDKLMLTPEQIMAALGPCIGKAAFETGEDVVQQVNTTTADPSGLVTEKGNGKYCVDLAGWIKRELADAGVVSVQDLDLCTYSDSTRFFSHRRDQGQTGRQASVILIVK